MFLNQSLDKKRLLMRTLISSSRSHAVISSVWKVRCWAVFHYKATDTGDCHGFVVKVIRVKWCWNYLYNNGFKTKVDVPERPCTSVCCFVNSEANKSVLICFQYFFHLLLPHSPSLTQQWSDFLIIIEWSLKQLSGSEGSFISCDLLRVRSLPQSRALSRCCSWRCCGCSACCSRSLKQRWEYKQKKNVSHVHVCAAT